MTSSAAVAGKMIDRMKGFYPAWRELISQSFLTDGMKTAYCKLIENRIARL
ncbi:MAG: hypothetical protein IJT74_04550 [Bacteroidales bacterium]|nr:hypothetical protein [Bacteroidales bacterium]